MQEDTPAAAPAVAPAEAKDAPMGDAPKAAEAPAAATGVPGAAGEEMDSKWFQDPSFVQELLGSLPGVDINDPRIQSALKEVGRDEKDKDTNDGDASGSGDKSGGSGDAK